ncbi:MAG: hypothetical protein ACRDQY_03380 [Pseudonocardiaceae bacterium]
MTDGTYAGLDDTAILEYLRTTQENEDEPDGQSGGADEGGSDHGEGPGKGPEDEGETEDEGELRHDGEPDDDNGSDGGGGPEDGDGPEGDGPEGDGPEGGGPDGGETDGGGAAEGEYPAVAEGSAWHSPVGAGMELRVRLSTLLGRDEYPVSWLAGGRCTPSWLVTSPPRRAVGSGVLPSPTSKGSYCTAGSPGSGPAAPPLG